MQNLGSYRLGQSPDEILSLTTRQEISNSALIMTKQSSKKLEIISKNLEPSVYNQSDFVDAIKNLALNGHRAQIRILVSDIESIINVNHRLLSLCSKLPSFIQLRKISPEYKNFNKALLIADRIGYIYRENASRYEGSVNFNSPRYCKNYLNLFEEMWEMALLDRNLRRLNV